MVDLQPGGLAVDGDLGEEVARGAVGVVLHREVVQLQLLRQEDRDPLFADGLVVRAVAKYGYAQRLLLGASNYTGKECQPQPCMVEDKTPAVAPRRKPRRRVIIPRWVSRANRPATNIQEVVKW